jgi:hypothetical protein
MFQFPRLPPHTLWIQVWVLVLRTSGLPHSEIFGSKLTYSSPKHIGVRPVLHRLLAPRHPPCALSSLLFLGYYPVISSLSHFQGATHVVNRSRGDKE